MRRIKYLALAALAVFAACDEDPPGTGPVTGTGTVAVTVTAGGAPAAGVTVSLGAAGTQPAQTSATGQVTFTNVAVGTYVVSVSGLSGDFACPQTSQPVTVGSGQTTSVTFACGLVSTSSISGSVTNNNGSARPNTSLTITRTAPAPAGTPVTVTTGTDGQFSLTGLRSGTYTVTLPVTTGCNTTAITQTVTITAGEARVVNFTCTVVAPPPTPEPATVAIQSITTGPLGTGATVPDNAVRGLVNVHIAVNEGGQRVTRVELLLGSQVVCTQNRTVAAPEDMQLAEFMVSCPVATNEFNATTGVPRFFNTATPAGAANNVFTARIYTVAGGPTTPAATASRAIQLVNADFASVTVRAARTVIGGTAATGRAAAGLAWWTGDLTIRALAVFFSGHTANNITITVDGYNATAHAPSSGGASTRAAYLADPLVDNSTVSRVLTAAPWETTLLASQSITAGNSTTASTRGVGDLEDLSLGAGGAFSITVATIRDDEQPGFGGPVVFTTICDDGTVPNLVNFPPPGTGCASGQPPSAIRYDTFAPVIDQMEQVSRWSSAYAWVPPPAPESGTGVTRWVHEGHVFEFTTSGNTTTDPRATDRGTGIADSGFFTFEAGSDLAALVAVTSGANLAETPTNNVYYIRGTARDIAGNSRARFNNGTSRGLASPLNTDRTTEILADADARIGADHHNPFMQLLNGTNLNLNQEVIGPLGPTGDGTAIVSQYIDCHGTVDGATGICTVDTFTSNPSGFPPNPVLTRIRREFPAITVGAGCWVGDFDDDDNECNRLGTQANQSGTTGNYDFTVGSYTWIHPLTGATTTVMTAGDGTVLSTLPVGYYRVELQTVDAAGNLSGAIDIRLVRDQVAPNVGGASFPATLTPGSSVTFQAGVSDNLELNRAEFFLVFGAEGAPAPAPPAFRQSVTQLGTFGPGDGTIGPNGYTQQSFASATVPFVYSLQTGSDATDIPTATTAGMFRVSDFGRNSASAATSPFPPPTTAPRDYGAGAASVAITRNSENLTSTVPFLCWDTDADGCGANVTTTTLSFTVSGAGSAVAGGPLTIPFTRLEFYVGLDENNDGVIDQAGGAELWTSMGVAGVSVTENVGATVRTYNWSRAATGAELAAAAGRTTLSAATPDPLNNIWIRVVGYSADGAAFTLEGGGSSLCPAPGSAPPGSACAIQLARD